MKGLCWGSRAVLQSPCLVARVLMLYGKSQLLTFVTVKVLARSKPR